MTQYLLQPSGAPILDMLSLQSSSTASVLLLYLQHRRGSAKELPPQFLLQPLGTLILDIASLTGSTSITSVL